MVCPSLDLHYCLHGDPRLSEISLGDDVFVLIILMKGVAKLCRDTMRLWRVSPQIYRQSADYSQPHSDSFGNFQERFAFALASTFLFGGGGGGQ